ncbi:MAG: hypothetical protein IJK71_10615 [Clostridia bacterium]|nr:hypothetical protein [Clostridia bacterium]
MKNRFIQMFLVICAVMLMICAVSVWAAAEDANATPTDLAPVEQEESVPETTEPETTEPETTEPETTEPEAQEPQAAEPEVTEPEETADDEEASDSVEIIITKAVRIGDSWSGTMKKTKPAVLKLDIDHAQQVNLVVLGRHGWITVEKSDRLSDNPARTLTNDETSQTVISWYAEAGSYLVTLGPVEPNLMAKLNVFIMNDAGYESWLAERAEPEEQTEEPVEESEEPVEEPAEEPEEQPEEPEEQIEEEPEEEEETTEETVNEPIEEPTEPEENTEEENIPESEERPERHITVDVTWDVPDPVIGDTAHFKAIMEGYEGLQYTVQWQYSPDENTWYDIPNETETTMDVVVTPENNIVYWRILVYLEDNQID